MKKNIIVLLFFIIFSSNAMESPKEKKEILSLIELCIFYVIPRIGYYQKNYLSQLKGLTPELQNKIEMVSKKLKYKEAKMAETGRKSIFRLKDIGFSTDSNFIAVAADGEELSKIMMFSSTDFIEKGKLSDSFWTRKLKINTLKVLPENNDMIAGFSKGIIERITPTGQTSQLLKMFINKDNKKRCLSAITAIALHYNNTKEQTDYFISSCASHTDSIRLWQMPEGINSACFNAQYSIKALACLQKEAKFLVLEKDCIKAESNILKLWDIATKKELCRWTKLSGSISAMALLKNDVLLTGTNYGYFSFVDARADAIAQEYVAHDCGGISSIAANMSNDLIVSGCENGAVKLWDTRLLRNPVGACTTKGDKNEWVIKVDFAANGTKVAAIMMGDYLAAWDVNNFNQIAQKKFIEG